MLKMQQKKLASLTEHAKDSGNSKEIMNAYISRYATEKCLGEHPTAEEIARIHNGGPNGYKKEATEKYWDKV